MTETETEIGRIEMEISPEAEGIENKVEMRQCQRMRQETNLCKILNGLGLGFTLI